MEVKPVQYSLEPWALEQGRSLRIGVLHWHPEESLAARYCQQLDGLGHEPVVFQYNEALPEGLDVVFVHGPLDSLAPLTAQMLDLPRSLRPALAFLMTEQLPDPDLPEPFRRAAGELRSWVERQGYDRGENGIWRPRKGWAPLVTRARRFRYYGDLYWMRRHGLLSTLAIWSGWTAEYLRRRGFDVLVPPQGYNPEWGCDMGLERDIPVLWLGKIGSARRGRLLDRLRGELRQHGIEILVIDGRENPYVFHEERTILLNRTRIMLNLLREKWDDNSMRYVMAAHNRVLIVSEPTLPHSPFRPGEHLVEAPVERLADTVRYYLDHEEERRTIASRAYAYVTQDLNPGRLMATILAHAMQSRRRAAGMGGE